MPSRFGTVNSYFPKWILLKLKDSLQTKKRPPILNQGCPSTFILRFSWKLFSWENRPVSALFIVYFTTMYGRWAYQLCAYIFILQCPFLEFIQCVKIDHQSDLSWFSILHKLTNEGSLLLQLHLFTQLKSTYHTAVSSVPGKTWFSKPSFWSLGVKIDDYSNSLKTKLT